MIVFAPAKINIGLYVTERRLDGYHNIESVLYPVPLEDVIEIMPSRSFYITEYGFSSQCKPEENLCSRAWKLLSDLYSIPPVKINLLKNIPVQAGLGGGSSDAVALLKGLDKMFEIGLSSKDMRRLAFQIGSDCPFFVDAVPALSLSRGELLQPLSLSLENLWLLIFKPSQGISTAQAFSETDANPHGKLQQHIMLPVESWRNSISNVFQHIFLQKFPEIQTIIDGIDTQNPVFLSLSGSGSAFFALSTKPLNMNQIPKEWFVYQTLLSKF